MDESFNETFNLLEICIYIFLDSCFLDTDRSKPGPETTGGVNE